MQANVGSAFLSSVISSGIGSGTSGLSKTGQLGVSALTGAGLSTAISGGNFFNGALDGAIAGGIGGGIGGLIDGNPLVDALNNSPKLAMIDPPTATVFGGVLDEVIVWGSRVVVGVEVGAASLGAAIGAGLYGAWELSKAAANSGRGTSFMMDGHPSQTDLQKMLNEHYRMTKKGKTEGGVERMGKQNGKAPRNNQAQNEQTDYLSKKHGLSRKQQDVLHRRISKQGLGFKDIEDIIENEIKKP